MIFGNAPADQVVAGVLNVAAREERNFGEDLGRQLARLRAAQKPQPFAVEGNAARGVADEQLELAKLGLEQGFRRPPLAVIQLILKGEDGRHLLTGDSRPADAAPRRARYPKAPRRFG